MLIVLLFVAVIALSLITHTQKGALSREQGQVRKLNGRTKMFDVILQEMAFSEYNPEAAFDAFDRGDYETVLKLASPHAVAGNPDAQCMVSLLHQCGFGVKRDVLEAERWLLKAAEQNPPLAWNNLGTLYALKCPELERHWSDANECYQRAKELGFNCAEPYPP
jgi:TPR repeat protein